jgi:CotH kinase protein
VGAISDRYLSIWGIATLLVWVALTLAVTPASADEAEWMYDPDAVVDIHLGGLSEEELDTLEVEPDEYQKGTFELKVDGVTKGMPLVDVGIRLKGGHGSGRPIKTGKSGLKIRFDEFVKGQFFFGLKRLTLNNMIQDPSMVHETLSYELFRALDLPASRTGYAFVTLNGDDYGLFLNLETLDKIALPRWFESTLHLYEADEPGTDVTPGDVFEVDEGKEDDIADLEALIAAANDTEGDWSDGMAAVADLEQMTRMWAVERYVGHWDGYAGVADDFRPNNYYLHSLDSGVFEMMPWGTDQTWDMPVEFDEPAGGVLFNNCLADASCAALYESALGEVAAVVPGLGLDRRARCTAELLAPWQKLEDPSRRETDAAEIAEGVADARTFISLRPGELAEWLGTEAPPAPAFERPCVDESGMDVPDLIPVAPDRVILNPPLATEVTPTPLYLRLRAVTIDGNRLKARVVAPAAGTLRLTATTQGRKGSAVCGARKKVQAGVALVACKLSEAARRALEQGPLKLNVTATLRATATPVEPASRAVTLPARP